MIGRYLEPSNCGTVNCISSGKPLSSSPDHTCISFRSYSPFTTSLLLSYCQMKHLSWFSSSMKIMELLADIHYDKSSGLKLSSHLGFAIMSLHPPGLLQSPGFSHGWYRVFYLCNSWNYLNSKHILHLILSVGRDETAIVELRTEEGLLIAAWVHLRTEHLTPTARWSCELVCGFTEGAERAKLAFC